MVVHTFNTSTHNHQPKPLETLSERREGRKRLQHRAMVKLPRPSPQQCEMLRLSLNTEY